jgi:hypothetical protein
MHNRYKTKLAKRTDTVLTFIANPHLGNGVMEYYLTRGSFAYLRYQNTVGKLLMVRPF